MKTVKFSDLILWHLLRFWRVHYRRIQHVAVILKLIVNYNKNELTVYIVRFVQQFQNWATPPRLQENWNWKSCVKWPKTKEPRVRTQEKRRKQKVSRSSLHSKTIQSKLHSYGEEGEILVEKVLSKDWDPYSSKLRSKNSYSGWIQEAFRQLNPRQIPYY